MGNNGSFKPGHPCLKPKGAISKKKEFENFLFACFRKNKEKAEEMLNLMFLHKQDFKWLCGLLADRCPKEIEHSGEIGGRDTNIVIVKSGDKVDERIKNRIEAVSE